MHTFRVLEQQIGMVPASVARTLGAIDTARGREDAFRIQRPQVLEALVGVARIQSTEASNAIEQVVAPRKRIEALVADETTPRNRSEAEIAGYRAVRLWTMAARLTRVSAHPPSARCRAR